jgi:reverse gyrase
METTSPIVNTTEAITYIDILQLLGFGTIVFVSAMIGVWLADYIKYRLKR